MSTVMSATKSPAKTFRPAERHRGGRCDELAVLDRMGTVVTLGRDASMFLEGDPVRYFFKVITGAVRSCRLLADGRRHIGDFYLPGDFVAVDEEGTHRFTAEAVTESTLMRYPRGSIDRLSGVHPGFGRTLFGLVCDRLSTAQKQMLLLGRKTATERIASFLLTMTERGDDTDHVWLPMTRGDIADHLGLTMETVSRVFSQLKAQRVIQLDGANSVLVRDGTALEELADAG